MNMEFEHRAVFVNPELAVYYGPRLIGVLQAVKPWNDGRDMIYAGERSGMSYTLQGAAIAEARAVIFRSTKGKNL